MVDTSLNEMLQEAIRIAKDADFSEKNGAGDKRSRTAVIEREYDDTNEVPLDERCFQCDILFGLWESSRRSVLGKRRNGNKSLNLADEELTSVKDEIAHSIRYASLKGITGRLGEAWPASLKHWDECPFIKGELD